MHHVRRREHEASSNMASRACANKKLPADKADTSLLVLSCFFTQLGQSTSMDGTSSAAGTSCVKVSRLHLT